MGSTENENDFGDLNFNLKSHLEALNMSGNVEGSQTMELSAGEEDLREIARANKKSPFKSPRMSFKQSLETKSRTMSIHARSRKPPRKTGRGKQTLKPPNNREKDGPACPVCDAVFKTAELATLHFDRVHMQKRVRNNTKKLAQTQPAKQSSAVVAANAQSSLSGWAAQLTTHENTEYAGEVTSSVLRAGVVDYQQETWNALFEVPYYADDIFKYLKQRESAYKIKCYISGQLERSRSVLVDRMATMQQAQGLYPETLFLAVKIIDAYLGEESIAVNQLPMLGGVALWIACKYVEHKTIDIITDKQNTQEKVPQMEKAVLQAINFDLGFPLSLEFLRRCAQCSNASIQLLTLASFILEFSLMFYSLIQVKGSAMACAVLFMARRMIDQEGWNATLEHHSGYKVADFAYIVKHLYKLLRQTPAEGIASIKTKYLHADYYKVADITLKDINSLLEEYPEALA